MDQKKHNTGKGKWKQLTEKERYKIETLYEEGLHATILDSELRRTPAGNCPLSGLTGSLCRHARSA